MPGNEYMELQVQRNVSTAERREAYAGHRERLTRLILNSPLRASGTGSTVDRSLALLGAGNGNDVDLERLASSFQKIALFDLDGAAVSTAIGQLPEGVRNQVSAHVPCDLAGLVDCFTDKNGRRPSDDSQIQKYVEALAAHDVPELRQFDVVVSCCMLSQLVEMIGMLISASHPRFVELVLEARWQHCKLVCNGLLVDGTGLVITDFVSSKTLPGLAKLSEQQLPLAMQRTIDDRNFFTGTNIAAIHHDFQRRDPLARMTKCVTPLRPWRWDLGDRLFFVSGIRFQRVGVGD